MIYTPNNLNLQPRTVWQVDTGDGETEIEFSWNPKGSMVIVRWLHYSDARRSIVTQIAYETDSFTMGQASPPTEAEVEEAIAAYLNDNGIVVWTD